MDKKIQSIDYNKIFGVDIETVRQEKNFNEDSPSFDNWAWKCRNMETNEIPDTEEVIKRYNTQAALYPEYGKIVCISVGYISDGVVYTKSYTGDEKKILRDFTQVISGSGRKLLVHNKGFDLPYIQKRFCINFPGELFPEFYSTFNIKPWESDNSVICTMETWKNIGWQSTSLADLSMCFGIPTPKDDIRGNEVSRVYWEEQDISRISKYCEKDVMTVMNILRVWKGDEILENVSKTDVQLNVSKVPVLNRIYQTAEITDFDIEELKELLKDKKISKKEKDMLKKMIYNLSLETDMFKYETKEVKEEKMNKITNLLK